MSRYDIEVAHGDRAEEALQTARGLVRNHIVYCVMKVSHRDLPARKITLFGDSLPTPDPLSP